MSALAAITLDLCSMVKPVWHGSWDYLETHACPITSRCIASGLNQDRDVMSYQTITSNTFIVCHQFTEGRSHIPMFGPARQYMRDGIMDWLGRVYHPTSVIKRWKCLAATYWCNVWDDSNFWRPILRLKQCLFFRVYGAINYFDH